MSEHVMGIEIGSSNIKIIEVSRKAATLLVHKFSLIETPKDCMNNGFITESGLLKKVIEEELKNKKYHAKKVVGMVQSNNILIRNVVMEKQPEKVIRSLLELKPEEYLPVEKNQYQIDFRITKTFKEDGIEKIELLLVAAPNSLVFPMASLLKSLKLTPKLITIPSEALGSVLGQNKPLIYDTAPNVMVLDIGGHASNATILAGYQPVLTRGIEFGMEDIRQMIMAHTNEEEQGVQSSPILEKIKPQLEYHMISELERILQFYYSNYSSGTIKKLYLIGGGSNIRGLRSYIRDALNIPTEKIMELGAVMEVPKVEFEPYRRFFVNLLGAINGL